MLFDISEFVIDQDMLDLEIFKVNNVDYDSTKDQRSIGLLVNIGRLSEQIGSYKYWAKPNEISKDNLLITFANILHFYLTFVTDLHIERRIFDVTALKEDLNKQFIGLYWSCLEFIKLQDEDSFIFTFQKFLDLGASLGFDCNDIEFAYRIKIKSDFKRKKEQNY